MNTETLDRLEADIASAVPVGYGTIIVQIQELSALLSIARRAADVEGMADVLPDFWTRETGFATAKENATAVSRYVMGETT